MSDSIVILYRGGRLPCWYQLTAADQIAFQNEHVDLMLTVGADYGLQSIEGFHLLAPQGNWQRWWTMRFPDLRGAEAWMKAETAPPYGRYGYYEYELARSVTPEALSWLPEQDRATPPSDVDPRVVPPLKTDKNSMVVLCFGCWTASSEADGVRQQVAADHRMLHGECFQLLGPGPHGDMAWTVEFPALDGAEAWIETESQPPACPVQQRTFHLARRWAPDYFASWTAPQA